MWESQITFDYTRPDSSAVTGSYGARLLADGDGQAVMLVRDISGQSATNAWDATFVRHLKAVAQAEGNVEPERILLFDDGSVGGVVGHYAELDEDGRAETVPAELVERWLDR